MQYFAFLFINDGKYMMVLPLSHWLQTKSFSTLEDSSFWKQFFTCETTGKIQTKYGFVKYLYCMQHSVQLMYTVVYILIDYIMCVKCVGHPIIDGFNFKHLLPKHFLLYFIMRSLFLQSVHSTWTLIYTALCT